MMLPAAAATRLLRRQLLLVLVLVVVLFGIASEMVVDVGGSSEVTLLVCAPGHMNGEDGIVVACPVGYYCTGDGDKQPCPAGRFGASKNLASSNCSGECEAGFFCPSLSLLAHAQACGPHHTKYCPPGSARPLTTAVGFYTSEYLDPLFTGAVNGGFGAQHICEAGYYCIDGVKYACPSGRFGNSKGSFNASCTGPCSRGFYCPLASTSSYQVMCTNSPAFYCPPASSLPTKVDVGYYTYGNTPTPLPDAFTSKNDENINSYLQQNLLSKLSSLPIDDGPESGTWVSIRHHRVLLMGESFHGLKYHSQRLCEAGYFCIDGLRYLCPGGRYGASEGMSSPDCTGPCIEGYFCHEASTTPKQFACGGADRFCITGSHFPQLVHDGYYSVRNTVGSDFEPDTTAVIRVAERRCGPGFWCLHGVRFFCQSGSYGNTYGETNPACTGQCLPGYYCPEGSTNATEIKCGDAGRYCPGFGNWRTTSVSLGYYSVGGTESTRTGQVIAPIGHYAVNGLIYTCKAGFYGQSQGLSDPYCSGPCNVPGYYCPSGSISPLQHVCGGDDVICPPSTVAPIAVTSGFYTADYLYESCPPGKYRPEKGKWVNPWLPQPSLVITETHNPGCVLCDVGKFKAVRGDNSSLCLHCNKRHSVSAPDRTTCLCTASLLPDQVSYFNITGNGTCITYSKAAFRSVVLGADWAFNISLTRFEQNECEPGHYCQQGQRYRCPAGRYGATYRETNPFCQGPCADGYYCQSASISPFSSPCGATNVICFDSASVPTLVPPGYYSTPDAPDSLRSAMQICEKGFYCPGDGIKYSCPSGRYASSTGTISNTCDGPCLKGYYCLEGSSTATQFACGNASVICPGGSSLPRTVTVGFYSAFSGPDSGSQALWDKANSTCSVELPCEPGYYCIDGIKYPCPPGTFGWRYGATSSACGGQCAPGHYCPSYLEPQPDAPSHTVWPRAPHTSSNEYQCGGVTFVCPRGSFFPMTVGGGNYTVGGDITNNTRSGQEICKPGTFCAGGIVHLCPKGRYGANPGSSVSSCTDWCPPGFYCPAGTANPFQCGAGTYSAGASWACSECPGTRSTPLLCQDSRACCFRG